MATRFSTPRGVAQVSLSAMTRGPAGPAGGDGDDGQDGSMTGPVSSVDSEIVLFSGTGGSTVKRASGSGFVAAVNGVYTGPRTLTAPAAGMTITNPAGESGDPTFAFANDLAAVEALSGTGLVRRTGTDTWTVGTLVANAELADMADSTIKGRSAGSGTGVPEDLTGDQVATIIPEFLPDDGSNAGTKGQVPAPAAGDLAANKVLGVSGWVAAGQGDMVAANDLSDVDDAPTAFDNIKQAGTDAYAGVLELATTGEVVTGTDTARAVTAAGVLAALKAQVRELIIAASDETTALTTGQTKVTFRAPRAMTLVGIRASLATAQGSGSIFTTDVNVNGSSILSTKCTIDNGEKTSATAATQPVISSASIADDDEMTFDIDQIGNSTAKGLKFTLYYTIP